MNNANPATDAINITYAEDGFNQKAITDFLNSQGLGDYNVNFTTLPADNNASGENATFSITVQPQGQQLNVQ